VTEGPTPRMLDALAAWWQCGGSNVAAAKVMGVTPQVMRNTLMAFRREQRAPTNIGLIQRFMGEIEHRTVLPATSHKASRSEAEHAGGANVTPVPSVAARSHNISFRDALAAGEPNVTLVRRTRVRVVDLHRERLRKQMVQAGVWRKEPFYLRHATPARLERRHLRALNLGQIQRSAVAEVDARVHRGTV